MQPMAWGADGWLRTMDGNGRADARGRGARPARRTRSRSRRCARTSTARTLPIDFQWLRSPWPDELFSLTARPGHLRLYGRETMGSLFRQALVARRQQAHCYSASTVVDFEPEHFQQMAGLICYYNGTKYHYLHVSHDEVVGPARAGDVGAARSRAGRRLHGACRDSQRPARASPGGGGFRTPLLRAIVWKGDDWTWLPQTFDASILSDEATAPGLPNFTGAFVGMACQDLAGTASPADFDLLRVRRARLQCGSTAPRRQRWWPGRRRCRRRRHWRPRSRPR